MPLVMHGRRMAGLLGLLLLWGGAIPTQARVYQRLGFSDRAEELVARLGWVEGYAARVQANGVEGRVEVFTSRYPVWRELERLRREEGEGQFFDGSQMGWGFVYDGDQFVRYLLVTAGPGDTATIFRWAVDAGDVGQARDRLPRSHRLTDVPVPDGAEPIYHFKDAGTRSEIEVSRTQVGRDQVADRLHEALVNRGWSPRTGAYTVLGVYTRKRDVLTVRVSSRDGSTIVTRIHKKGTVDGA